MSEHLLIKGHGQMCRRLKVDMYRKKYGVGDTIHVREYSLNIGFVCGVSFLEMLQVYG